MRINKAQTDSPKKQRQLAESPSQRGVSTRMREASRARRPRFPEGQRTPPKSDCPPLRQVSAVNIADAAAQGDQLNARGTGVLMLVLAAILSQIRPVKRGRVG